MWIERKIQPNLSHQVHQRPIVVLTGARQTGKTSLLKHQFPDFGYVTLDDPALADEAETSPRSFLERHSAPLVIDEIQYAPGLFRHIKSVVDQDRKKPGQYILTGSQKFALMENVSESLAGRASILELETLSVNEIKTAGISKDIDEIIIQGGFPELYESPDLRASDFYRSYLSSYLERDVRSISQVGSLRDFDRFLRSCALRSGQLLNKSDLARDVGISHTTANEWLSILIASNQIFLLEPWFSNGQKRMTKSPKLYFCDTGLMMHLLGISKVEDLVRSPLKGAIWETAVCAEIRKSQLYSEAPVPFYFYRDRGREVDFLFYRGGRFELMEAKWQEDPNEADCAPLKQVAVILGQENVISSSIVCRSPIERTLSNGINIKKLG